MAISNAMPSFPSSYFAVPPPIPSLLLSSPSFSSRSHPHPHSLIFNNHLPNDPSSLLFLSIPHPYVLSPPVPSNSLSPIDPLSFLSPNPALSLVLITMTAIGGALQCAMLSGRMKVKPFNMIDKLPYGIVVHYNKVANSGIVVMQIP